MDKTEGKQTTRSQKKELQIAIVTQMATLATSALGLVAALAWNNFIQELINNYIKKFLPANFGLFSLLLYAVIVSILAVVVTMNLSKLKKRLEEQAL